MFENFIHYIITYDTFTVLTVLTSNQFIEGLLQSNAHTVVPCITPTIEANRVLFVRSARYFCSSVILSNTHMFGKVGVETVGLVTQAVSSRQK